MSTASPGVHPMTPTKAERELGDLRLVLRAQRGDRVASDALIRRYKGFVRLKASSYFLAGGDADDVIQEGLIGLYKAIRDFCPEKETSFRSFAELCVTRQIITAVKTALRHKHSPLNVYVSFNVTPAGQEDGSTFGDTLPGSVAGDPVNVVISTEELQALVRMLGTSLSTLEADALRLFLEGDAYEQMSAKLEVSYKTIDNALQRVKRKIYAHWRTREGEALTRLPTPAPVTSLPTIGLRRSRMAAPSHQQPSGAGALSAADRRVRHYRRRSLVEFAKDPEQFCSLISTGEVDGIELMRDSALVGRIVAPSRSFVGETVDSSELRNHQRVAELAREAFNGRPTLIAREGKPLGLIVSGDVEAVDDSEAAGADAPPPIHLLPPVENPEPPDPASELLGAEEIDQALGQIHNLTQDRRRFLKKFLLHLEEQGGVVSQPTGLLTPLLQQVMEASSTAVVNHALRDFLSWGVVRLERRGKRTFKAELVRRLDPELIAQLHEELGDARIAPEPPVPVPIPVITPAVDHWALAEEYLARGDALLAESHEASAAVWIQAAQAHLGLAQRQAAAA